MLLIDSIVEVVHLPKADKPSTVGGEAHSLIQKHKEKLYKG